MHAIDIRFGKCDGGTNVICAGPEIDLRKNYETIFSQTGNISSFMSFDTATASLGYITNAGFTKRSGTHKTTDDHFAVEVQVQMSDHPLTEAEKSFDVYFAVKMVETIVVGKYPGLFQETLICYITYCSQQDNKRSMWSEILKVMVVKTMDVVTLLLTSTRQTVKTSTMPREFSMVGVFINVYSCLLVHLGSP